MGIVFLIVLMTRSKFSSLWWPLSDHRGSYCMYDNTKARFWKFTDSGRRQVSDGITHSFYHTKTCPSFAAPCRCVSNHAMIGRSVTKWQNKHAIHTIRIISHNFSPCIACMQVAHSLLPLRLGSKGANDIRYKGMRNLPNSVSHRILPKCAQASPQVS